MTDPSSIPQKAGDAANAVLSQAAAPCCTVGTEAFEASELSLLGEYTQMMDGLEVASETVFAEFGTAENGWVAVETTLQNQSSVPSWVSALVTAEWNVSKEAWGAAEAILAAEIDVAETSILAAEAVLAAEDAIFQAECCEAG